MISTSIVTDFNLVTPSNDQLMVSNSSSSKWNNYTLSDSAVTFDDANKIVTINSGSTISALSQLTTDCSVSSPSNHQLLMFSTYNSLNKWTSYSVSGVTIDEIRRFRQRTSTNGHK